MESLKSRLNEGKPANLHFFQDNNGREVDFLVPAECGVVPMEIQSAMTYTPEFESGIRYFQKVSGSTSYRKERKNHGCIYWVLFFADYSENDYF